MSNIKSIKGDYLVRVSLSKSEKNEIVEFVAALFNARMIQGEDTTQRFTNLAAYLSKKLRMFTKKVTIDGQTAHMLWQHMMKMSSNIELGDYDAYAGIMMKLADGLDAANKSE